LKGIITMWVKISDKEYLARNEISASDLKLVAKSPAHYLTKKLDLEDDITASMRIGKLVHAVFLEDQELILRPEGRKDSKHVKEFFEQLHKDEHWRVVTLDEKNTIFNIYDALRNCDAVSKLLDNTIKELSGIIEDYRIKVDAINDEIIVDLKTTVDSNPKDFQYQFFKMNYHLQAAYYVDIAEKIDGKKRDFYFVTVSTNEPHNVVCYKVSQKTLEQGRTLYKECLQKLIEAKTTGNYMGYVSSDTILEI